MRRGAEETPGRRAFALTATAFLWSAGLILAAVVVPVYGTTETRGGPGIPSVTNNSSPTLVGENGLGILLVVAVPALVTTLVWIALHDQCSRGRRKSGYLARGLIGLLGALCLVSALSIGLFVLPVALLLGGAATLTPTSPRQPDDPSRVAPGPAGDAH